MKLQYYVPEMDIIGIASTDIMAASGDGLENGGTGFGDSVPW